MTQRIVRTRRKMQNDHVLKVDHRDSPADGPDGLREGSTPRARASPPLRTFSEPAFLRAHPVAQAADCGPRQAVLGCSEGLSARGGGRRRSRHAEAT